MLQVNLDNINRGSKRVAKIIFRDITPVYIMSNSSYTVCTVSFSIARKFLREFLVTSLKSPKKDSVRGC